MSGASSSKNSTVNSNHTEENTTMRNISRSLASFTAIAIAIGVFAAVAKAEKLEGRWAATTVQGGVTIPFRLDISRDRNNGVATLFSGQDKEFTTITPLHACHV